MTSSVYHGIRLYLANAVATKDKAAFKGRGVQPPPPPVRAHLTAIAHHFLPPFSSISSTRPSAHVRDHHQIRAPYLYVSAPQGRLSRAILSVPAFVLQVDRSKTCSWSEVHRTGGPPL